MVCDSCVHKTIIKNSLALRQLCVQKKEGLWSPADGVGHVVQEAGTKWDSVPQDFSRASLCPG